MQKNGLGVCLDGTPEFGGMKPDSYYIRELLKEELMWPAVEDDRYVTQAQAHAGHGGRR